MPILVATCVIFLLFFFNFKLAQYILEDEVQNPGHGTPTFGLLGSGKWAHNQTIHSLLLFSIYF